MPSDVENMILEQLREVKAMVRDIQAQQHENALKVSRIEARIAIFAGIVSLVVAGAVQAASVILF